MRMIGKVRHTKLDCEYGCCDARRHNGKKGAKRSAKRQEERDMTSMVWLDLGSKGWPGKG